MKPQSYWVLVAKEQDGTRVFSANRTAPTYDVTTDVRHARTYGSSAQAERNAPKRTHRAFTPAKVTTYISLED